MHVPSFPGANVHGAPIAVHALAGADVAADPPSVEEGGA